MRMSPIEKARTHWSMWWGEDRYSEENTLAMCQEGIRSVRAGQYNAIRFNILHKSEQERIEDYMEKLAPEISYQCTGAIYD